MDITLAETKDLAAVRRYDRHIPPERLEECIRAGRVLVLRESETLLGVLRWSLFWQSIPFLDLIYLDEGCRGRGWGRRMMARWEAEMVRQGFRYLMLSTQADEDVKFFYENLGYRPIGAFLPPDQEAEELMYGKEMD